MHDQWKWLPLVIDYQHGFQQTQSCETQFLSTNFLKQCNADVIAMDLNKTFDAVPHRRLLKNLAFMAWMPSSSPGWRAFSVTKNKSYHWWRILNLLMSSLVSHRALSWVLCYFSFTLMTFHLLLCDCILYRPLISTKDVVILQCGLVRLSDWEKLWQIKFSISKCYIRVGKSLISV